MSSFDSFPSLFGAIGPDGLELFGEINSDTQLSVFNGATLADGFNIGLPSLLFPSTNVDVSLCGGSVGTGFDAFNGSTVNVTGGGQLSGLLVNHGSTLNVHRALFLGTTIDISAGGVANVDGGAFLSGSLLSVGDGGFASLESGGLLGPTSGNGGGQLDIDGGVLDAALWSRLQVAVRWTVHEIRRLCVQFEVTL